ncbi:MAG: hypothetical protein Kow0069_34590 [Promethearchaeota archaeon]
MHKVFGTSRRVRVLEVLLQLRLSRREEGLKWTNVNEVAREGGVSPSTAKRVVEELASEGLVAWKPDDYQTPVRNPVKALRLDDDNPVVRELAFFYDKLRGFL